MTFWILVAFWLVLCSLVGLLAQRKGLSKRHSHFGIVLLVSVIVFLAHTAWAVEVHRGESLALTAGTPRQPDFWASPAGGALTVFAVPLLYGLVLVLLPGNPAAGKKQCPDCAEFVQPEATVCRFCRHDFNAGAAPSLVR